MKNQTVKTHEIEEDKNNIEFLKSRLAKLNDNENAVLIDERESNIYSHPQFRRDLQNKQSARAVDTRIIANQHESGFYVARTTLHAAFKKRS